MIVAAASVLQCSMSDILQKEIETDPQAIEAIDFSELVGIGRAARLTGRSTGQIGRDANEGRLPYVLDEKKQKRYTINDLDKKYGLQRPKETAQAAAIFEQKREAADAVEIAVREARLEERVKALENENRGLRDDKERLWQQLQHQLPAPQPAAAPPVQKSLWQRILGT